MHTECSYLCEFNDDQKKSCVLENKSNFNCEYNVAILDNNYSFHANCNFLKQNKKKKINIRV